MAGDTAGSSIDVPLFSHPQVPTNSGTNNAATTGLLVLELA